MDFSGTSTLSNSFNDLPHQRPLGTSTFSEVLDLSLCAFAVPVLQQEAQSNLAVRRTSSSNLWDSLFTDFGVSHQQQEHPTPAINDQVPESPETIDSPFFENSSPFTEGTPLKLPFVPSPFPPQVKTAHKQRPLPQAPEAHKAASTTQQYLTPKKQTADGKTGYECVFCSKLFSRRGNLKEHLRIHTGEKPFQCEVCQKCFTHSATLSRHRKLHTDVMPFSCNQCPKTFRRKGDLVSHLRSHEKNSCGAKSSVVSNEGAQVGFSYHCQLCSCKYAHYGSLREHTKRKHPGMTAPTREQAASPLRKAQHLPREREEAEEQGPAWKKRRTSVELSTDNGEPLLGLKSSSNFLDYLIVH